MNEREHVLTFLGLAALNASLADVGEPPLGTNPRVRIAEPFILDFPCVVVDKPGVAPIRLLFGYELDVWVGPFSEVVDLAVSAKTLTTLREAITGLLRSEVHCEYRKRSVRLTLRLPGEEPWLKLTNLGRPDPATPRLDPYYEPYATANR